MPATGMHTALGDVSAAGVALLLTVTLILGVIGRGRKKLAKGPAQFVGFLAEIAFLRAPGTWNEIGTSVQSLPDNLATNPNLGHIGIGAVCLLCIIVSALAWLQPGSAAILGMLTGAAFAASTGSLEHVAVSFASALLSCVGA